MSKSVLSIIENVAKTDGERLAIKSASGELTYAQLWKQSDNLAAWLSLRLKDNHKPVMVYGHKDPQMIVCFLACVKSGRAYCPVDISMPKNRIEEIAASLDNEIILASEPLEMDSFEVVGSSAVRLICESDQDALHVRPVSGDDVYYIIFTSGSTGKPKGVEITADNLANFTKWSRQLAEKAGTDHMTFMNQAPFSFDLSVMDLYTSMTTGGTLICLDKQIQGDMASMFRVMRESGINCWVSTPSFAEMCLADHNFCQELMKELKLFLFCGERLTKETALKLSQRFPDARIVNTYGPTESTVAVTSIEIDQKVLSENDLLPIGKPRKGSELFIKDGEIFIAGDTVGKGYYKNPEKTAEAFIEMEDRMGNKIRAYKTGDRGYFDGKNYFCTGRKDFQVKLHGYRIELGDIEKNLMIFPEIEQAVVLPKSDGEKIRCLIAFIKSKNEDVNTRRIKTALKEKLPAYMVPKNIRFIENMPMTANGKIDRKKLEAEFV